MATTSKAQMKATLKYEAANYDKLTVRLPKGSADKIKAAGYTINAFISQAVLEKLDRIK